METPLAALPDAPPVLAKYHERALALILDLAPVLLFTGYLLWQYWLPRYQGEFVTEFRAWFETVREAMAAGETQPPKIPEEAKDLFGEGVQYIQSVLLLVTWLYFAAWDFFGRGVTFGKRILGLRVEPNEEPDLRPFSLFLRSGFKALTLFQPLFWVNFLVPLFDRKRRCGHDWIGRTRVGIGPPLEKTPPTEDA